MNIEINDFLKQLSDQTRLRCLMLLHKEDELCVCELIHSLGLSQPMISRHLANLREAGIVNSRREGQWIYYALHPDLPGWALDILASAQESVTGVKPYITDHESLCHMPNRPGAACCA